MRLLNRAMRARAVIVCCALVVSALAVAACATEPTPPATLIVNFLTPSTVRSVRVEITGPGLATPIAETIPIGPDSTARDTLLLPAGSDRRVVITASDSAGISTHRAEVTLALRPGTDNPPLSVRLEPLTGSLALTVTFAGVQVTVPNAAARTLAVGDTLRVTATATRPNGSAVPQDSLRWGSTNPAAFTVTRGLLRGVAPGAGSVVVSYQNVAAWVAVTVPMPTAGVMSPRKSERQ